MFWRWSIAVLLATTLPTGCASLTDNTVSLVAQKRTTAGWPFKRPTDPKPTPQQQASSTRALRDTQKKNAELSAAHFPETLSLDLRSRVESELADVSAEERSRLL